MYAWKRENKTSCTTGQIKNNMAYRRFRHFGKDKIAMDFSFLAIAFNIKNYAKGF